MLKRTIKYENLDGEMVEKEFYFNLTKAELVEMEMSNANGGGFEESMRRIVESNDGKAIMEEFEKIIMKTVGYRDGDDFIKTEDYRNRFKNSGAYSELFIELVTDAEAGARFINAVIPAHLAEKVRGLQRPGQPQDYQPKGTIAVEDLPINNEEYLATRNVFDSDPVEATPPTTATPDPTQKVWGGRRALTRSEIREMSPEEFAAWQNEDR